MENSNTVSAKTNLSGQHVWSLCSSFASYGKANFSHPFSALPRKRSALGLVLASAFVEFFLTALTLALEAFNDVDGSAHVTVHKITPVGVIAVGSHDAGGSVLTAEGVRCARERLSVCQARSGSQGRERNGSSDYVGSRRCRW